MANVNNVALPKSAIIPGATWIKGVTAGVNLAHSYDFDYEDFITQRSSIGLLVSLRNRYKQTSQPWDINISYKNTGGGTYKWWITFENPIYCMGRITKIPATNPNMEMPIPETSGLTVYYCGVSINLEDGTITPVVSDDPNLVFDQVLPPIDRVTVLKLLYKLDGYSASALTHASTTWTVTVDYRNALDLGVYV